MLELKSDLRAAGVGFSNWLMGVYEKRSSTPKEDLIINLKIFNKHFKSAYKETRKNLRKNPKLLLKVLNVCPDAIREGYEIIGKEKLTLQERAEAIAHFAFVWGTVMSAFEYIASIESKDVVQQILSVMTVDQILSSFKEIRSELDKQGKKISYDTIHKRLVKIIKKHGITKEDPRARLLTNAAEVFL